MFKLKMLFSAFIGSSLLISCGSVGTSISPLASKVGGHTIVQNGSVQLSTPIIDRFAGDLRIDVRSSSVTDLPPTLTINGSEFSRLPTSVEPGVVSYGITLDQALEKVSISQILLPGADGSEVTVVDQRSDPALSLIYQGNPTAVSVLDMAILLAKIQTGSASPSVIAAQANSLLASPNLINPDSLNPLPSEANSNYVEGGSGSLNTLDVAAILARIQVGTDKTAIANRINQLLSAPGLVSAASILKVPGVETPSSSSFSVQVIDQLSLTAQSFFLTQTGTTAVVGFGPSQGSAPVISGQFVPTGVAPVLSSVCGPGVIFRANPSAPVLVTDAQTGLYLPIFNQPDLVNSAAKLQLPVTLANQKLTLTRNSNNVLTLLFSAANFDELYRLNYLESRTVTIRSGSCISSTSGPTAVFNDTTFSVANLLGSTNVLLTLRGTSGGSSQPNGSALQGMQIRSDASLPSGIVEASDPRFSGVMNLLDVSGNALRTDAVLVFDVVNGDNTQAAIEPTNPGGNGVSTVPPFTVARGCPATVGSGLVCGRFQFNQAFTPTAVSDVLVISGTFVGRLAP